MPASPESIGRRFIRDFET